MKGMTILLVDDEPLIRLSMVDALEAVGYDVHASASGTEGLEVLREKSFDLVITDLCVFEVERGKGLRLIELAEGVTLEEVQAKTEAAFTVSDDLKTVAV